MTQISNEKKCSKCGKIYPGTLEYFNKDARGKSGLRSRCKECTKSESRERIKSGYQCPGRKESLHKYNKTDKAKKVQLKYRRTERGKALSRRTKLKHYYELTVDDYNDMFKEQDGRCGICGKHQTLFWRKLDVDHDHKTGQVRGLLCSACNRNLGRFEKGRRFNDWYSERFERYLRPEDAPELEPVRSYPNKIHYCADNETSACKQDGGVLTEDKSAVTCKNCKRTAIYKGAQNED